MIKKNRAKQETKQERIRTEIRIKNIGCIAEFLKKFYGLGPAEIECFLLLLTYGNELKADDIAEKAGKTKITVNRILLELYERGLVEREARCCTGGKRGRYFVYRTSSPRVLKEKFLGDLKEKTEALLELVKRGFEG